MKVIFVRRFLAAYVNANIVFFTWWFLQVHQNLMIAALALLVIASYAHGMLEDTTPTEPSQPIT